MGLVKPEENGKAKGRIAPPPPGVAASIPAVNVQPAAELSTPTHNAGNRMAAQNLLNAIISSPETAGRYTTHGEFRTAVAQDLEYFITLLKEKGYWSAD